MNKRITALICAAAAFTACTQTPAPANDPTTVQTTIETTAETTAETTQAQTEAEQTTQDTPAPETTAETTVPESDKPLQYTAPELSTLGWDTDFASMSNAKAFKVSDGDVVIDLDGDGKDETINFTHEN
ncbi:MAG: hypothetical protein ILP19_05580, partial [Oscillospiraceae bacterium]|nr:hypothetical protein [Oscillospiraceae bacterium]